MRELREDAETIADETDNPDIMERFRMPRGNNDEALATRAEAWATAIEELGLADEFAALGNDDDFVQDLRDRVEAFREAKDDQGEALGGQAGATDSLAELIRRAMACVGVLDRIIRKRLKGDAAKIGAWNSASHVERTGQKPKAAAAATVAKPA